MEVVYFRDGENVLFLVVLEKLVIVKFLFFFMDFIENRLYLEFLDNEDNDEVVVFCLKFGIMLKFCESDIRMLFLNLILIE